MSKNKTSTLVDIACETPREYRAVRNLCASYPHKAEFTQTGEIRVHDAMWFTRLLASCSGRVINERADDLA